MKSFFYGPHYTGISKVVFLSAKCAFLTSVCCVKRAYLYQACKRMLCELDCVKCRGHILHEKAFLKTTLDEVRVKIIQILSSCWWHFVTATSAIDNSCADRRVISHKMVTRLVVAIIIALPRDCRIVRALRLARNWMCNAQSRSHRMKVLARCWPGEINWQPPLFICFCSSIPRVTHFHATLGRDKIEGLHNMVLNSLPRLLLSFFVQHGVEKKGKKHTVNCNFDFQPSVCVCGEMTVCMWVCWYFYFFQILDVSQL